MAFGWLWRFAGRAAGPRDGQGLALETILPDTALATLAEPLPLPQSMRRQRAETLKVLSAKLLGAHLANRHQISYPLTIDFRTLAGAERDCLVDVAAAAAMAGGGGEAALAAAEARLARRGADAAVLERFRASAAEPLSVNALVIRAQASDRAAHAYAVSLLAAGSRQAAGQLYLTYLAARLGLSQEVVGSVNRRYRD
ncbi:DUF533 domain-containing protein [Aureimonas sp. AU40]|uniref:DUF533 domain-containing protein n=1 Tax=Aureimonas sp. AU40 TaxID=1637747 RepID=UPI0007849AC7|nr:DUF533 domain-containing protein [Aureimonas sp. AU40]